ncbi:MAG: lipoprotein NlpI [Vibrio sp.]
MKWFRLPIALLGLAVLSGCAAQHKSATQWLYPPMAVPLQASVQQEVQIARLSQLLLRTDLDAELRSKMLFERGNNYDSVGLRELAQLDFTQSLALNPAQPDVFNLLGVYYTEAGEFDAAYEAFDSTLELDPSNEYAVRNRAIALYYGERPQLALEEITKHYQQDPNDPFRAIWLYIIESDVNPEQARIDLQQRYQQHDEQWGWVLAGLMLDQLPEEIAFKAIIAGSRENDLLAQRLTEAYFYLGKRYQMQGELAQALSLYKLAISFNVYEYVEHRYAFLELGRIFQQVREERLATSKAESSTP